MNEIFYSNFIFSEISFCSITECGIIGQTFDSISRLAREINGLICKTTSPMDISHLLSIKSSAMSFVAK